MTAPAASSERVTLELSGMSCGHCIASVEKALKQLEGIRVESVGLNSATVEIDPRHSSRAAVTRAIEEAGYSVVSSRAA
jgi:copper chaperone